MAALRAELDGQGVLLLDLTRAARDNIEALRDIGDQRERAIAKLEAINTEHAATIAALTSQLHGLRVELAAVRADVAETCIGRSGRNGDSLFRIN